MPPVLSAGVRLRLVGWRTAAAAAASRQFTRHALGSISDHCRKDAKRARSEGWDRAARMRARGVLPLSIKCTQQAWQTRGQALQLCSARGWHRPNKQPMQGHALTLLLRHAVLPQTLAEVDDLAGLQGEPKMHGASEGRQGLWQRASAPAAAAARGPAARRDAAKLHRASSSGSTGRGMGACLCRRGYKTRPPYTGNTANTRKQQRQRPPWPWPSAAP